MLVDQMSRCMICPDEIELRTAHIDHCHETGAVRGLLCRSCNLGLGHFKDRVELLEKAMTYLKGAR